MINFNAVNHHWLGFHLPVLYVDFEIHTSEKGDGKIIKVANSKNFSHLLEVVFGLTG